MSKISRGIEDGKVALSLEFRTPKNELATVKFISKRRKKARNR